jgi:hypothetical protein
MRDIFYAAKSMAPLKIFPFGRNDKIGNGGAYATMHNNKHKTRRAGSIHLTRLFLLHRLFSDHQGNRVKIITFSLFQDYKVTGTTLVPSRVVPL